MVHQNPGRRVFESPGMSRPSRRLALQAKSNRAPGIKAPEPACAGRMCLQHSPGMVGTLAREQRLRGTRIVRLQQRTNGTTLRASRSDGEGRRLPGTRSRFPYLAAAQSEAPARPCPTTSASSPGDSSLRGAVQFASGAFRQVRRHDRGTPGEGSRGTESRLFQRGRDIGE